MSDKSPEVDTLMSESGPNLVEKPQGDSKSEIKDPPDAVDINENEKNGEDLESTNKVLEHAAQLAQKLSLLESKLELATKQKELAQKEKEAMVIKYAVSEKNLLEMRHQKEQIEKKYKEQITENEIIQHKVQVMCSEKSRICQMLDNKCYEFKSCQQELEQAKTDLNALETKLKWSQNNLKTEIQLHKETQIRLEEVNRKCQEASDQIEQARKDAQESIKSFHTSQDNRAHVLDQQLKELQASLILLKHEKDDKEQQTKSLNSQLEKLQSKQKDMLQENNDLSLKVQQLERDRLESEQKLSDFKACADQQRQDCADLQAKTALLDQLKLQLRNEQDQNRVCNDQIGLLKQRNAELEADILACREREAELLLFTQQLTEKNVRLQSEFTALETKVQQLTCEQAILKRSLKEQETKNGVFSAQMTEERAKLGEEVEGLRLELSESRGLCEKLREEVGDHKGENKLLKRKFELSLREVNKELQQCRKKLEQFEMENQSSSSSNSSLSVGSPATEQVKVIQPDPGLDRQTLIEHIVKLQRISARKSEKLDFLEEHVNTLVLELQKKSRLLQSYILRDQSGTLTSNTMDNNKSSKFWRTSPN
ncbi:coiled-coil domain-containing protein 186 isoform X2 [Tribolium madens]|uniref:coiled-coil domain-containing protein 186 isoform X2 n=1 Tax=Tribolium madens TaxID=41895 RepID=UPI001CF73943|nr:coiled-coil domain-containing protein 186 isoform X2 [Tribolium madens]